MPTSRTSPHHTRLTIEEHLPATAQWYVVVDDVASNGDCTFEVDAWIIHPDEGYPNPLFVVLHFCEPDAPTFAYAPQKTHGLVHEAAIIEALVAFRDAHPGLIPALDRVEVSEPEA